MEGQLSDSKKLGKHWRKSSSQGLSVSLEPNAQPVGARECDGATMAMRTIKPQKLTKSLGSLERKLLIEEWLKLRGAADAYECADAAHGDSASTVYRSASKSIANELVQRSSMGILWAFNQENTLDRNRMGQVVLNRSVSCLQKPGLVMTKEGSDINEVAQGNSLGGRESEDSRRNCVDSFNIELGRSESDMSLLPDKNEVRMQEYEKTCREPKTKEADVVPNVDSTIHDKKDLVSGATTMSNHSSKITKVHDATGQRVNEVSNVGRNLKGRADKEAMEIGSYDRAGQLSEESTANVSNKKETSAAENTGEILSVSEFSDASRAAPFPKQARGGPSEQTCEEEEDRLMMCCCCCCSLDVIGHGGMKTCEEAQVVLWGFIKHRTHAMLLQICLFLIVVGWGGFLDVMTSLPPPT